MADAAQVTFIMKSAAIHTNVAMSLRGQLAEVLELAAREKHSPRAWRGPGGLPPGIANEVRRRAATAGPIGVPRAIDGDTGDDHAPARALAGNAGVIASNDRK